MNLLPVTKQALSFIQIWFDDDVSLPKTNTFVRILVTNVWPTLLQICLLKEKATSSRLPDAYAALAG